MTPLDETGLVLFARMKEIHIAFLMEEKFWTTQHNHEFKCSIILAFRGNLTFNDTRKKQVPLPKLTPASVKQKYMLQNRDSSKDKSPPPTPTPNRHTPASPPGKVVIRTHRLPKKQPKVHVLKCHLCKSTMDTEKNLRIHYQQAHKEFTFHCQYCNKKCSSRNNL